jgi:pseudaminic acid synthase
VFRIGNKEIGDGNPVFIIAELSGNHGGNIGTAKEIISKAAETGVDAVKLQTYTADTITIDSDNPDFIVRGGELWEGEKLYDLYSQAFTPWEWHSELFEFARSLGLEAFSSPFDKTAVDFLEDLGVPAYKIASFELIDLPLIKYVATKGRPMIMSTGMATKEEILEAVAAAKEGGCEEIALLRCNSAYPAPIGEMDLKTIPDMRESFGVPVGLSDHTLGVNAAISAVSLGGCIIEKHLCLSRSDPGPDSEFSLEPDEMRALVRGVRDVQESLGEVRYGPSPREEHNLQYRRSIYVVEDIPLDGEISEENVRSIRPGLGLHPKFIDSVIGMSSTRFIPAGTALRWEDLKER